jgi:hypothetical protein
MLVDKCEECFEFVLLVDERVHRPVCLDIVRVDDVAGNDAKVVTSAAERPEQICVLGSGGFDKRAIREDDARGDKVVERIAELTLEERVTSPKEGSYHGYAFGKTSYYIPCKLLKLQMAGGYLTGLLLLGEEISNDLILQSPAPNCRCLAPSIYRRGIQLPHPDLESIWQSVNCIGPGMGAGYC